MSTYKDFNEIFERPIEAGIEGAGQKLRKIVHPFILRRLKSQVEKELPERTDIINLCELEDDQRSLYLDVLDECRQKVFSEIASPRYQTLVDFRSGSVAAIASGLLRSALAQRQRREATARQHLPAEAECIAGDDFRNRG